ncbi:hypothetical protein [Kitasatospora sp. NPDC093806]|uniref:hypothetical protein n=1 Tax=Kitasatospora sp. NPDC093806 TaxID=3155075 RepID=UPI003430C390
MTGLRKPAGLTLVALALAAAPAAPAFAADGGVGGGAGGGEGATHTMDFGSTANCLREFATVPALGSHGAGPTTCTNGDLLGHTLKTVGSLTS